MSQLDAEPTPGTAVTKVQFKPYITVSVDAYNRVIKVETDWIDTCQGVIDPVTHEAPGYGDTPAEQAACNHVDALIKFVDQTLNRNPENHNVRVAPFDA